MRNAIRLSVMCVVVIFGCAQPQRAPIGSRVATDRSIAWPEDWSNLLGQKVTVEGWAGGSMQGSELYADRALRKNSVYVDGVRWPHGYLQDAGKSKHLRVTGTVIT